MKGLSEIINPKTEIRNKVKKIILELPDREEKDTAICRLLATMIPDSGIIISYRADRYEPSLDKLWEQKKNVKVYYPRVTGSSNMEFIYPEKWYTGPHGIPEPEGSDIIEPENADLALVPALAFNAGGFRLGRGQGYYDRKMAGTGSNALIGVTYEDVFPADFMEEKHDKAVGRVVTEKRIIPVG